MTKEEFIEKIVNKKELKTEVQITIVHDILGGALVEFEEMFDEENTKLILTIILDTLCWVLGHKAELFKDAISPLFNLVLSPQIDFAKNIEMYEEGIDLEIKNQIPN